MSNVLKHQSVVRLGIFTADPVGVPDGSMWYNSTLNSFRQRVNGQTIDVAPDLVFTENRAIISDNEGKLTVSTVTNTEMGHLSGVTSPVQTQLNEKIPSTEKGSANGVAELDAASRLPSAQLTEDAMQFKGEFENNYSPETVLTAASFTGQVAGMTSDVTIDADVAGLAGNVALVGDGVKDIDDLISDHNTASPGNELTLSSGDGSQVPDDQEELVLSGGEDAVAEVDEYVPALADGVGTLGDIYTVVFSGTYDAGSGDIDFLVGDKVYYNGSIWERWIASHNISSVNGQQGAIILTTDDIDEGSVNLYYTSARFDAAFASKTTDDLDEGSANLYFTDSRAQTASVVNSISGGETNKAPSVSAVKTYMDSRDQGLEPKGSVRVASVAEVALSGLDPLDIDGITLAQDDRVLLLDQSNPVDNGVYVYLVDGSDYSLERSADFDGNPSNEVKGGDWVFVEEGIVNENTSWAVLGSGNKVVGTDPIEFTIVSKIGAIDLGDLSDVAITAPADDDIIIYDGGQFVNKSLDDVLNPLLDEKVDVDLQNILPTSSVPFNSQRLTSVADPVDAQDVATKSFVEDQIDSIILGAEELDDLSDVTITAPANDDILVYDSGQFVNTSLSDIIEESAVLQGGNATASELEIGTTTDQNVIFKREDDPFLVLIKEGTDQIIVAVKDLELDGSKLLLRNALDEAVGSIQGTDDDEVLIESLTGKSIVIAAEGVTQLTATESQVELGPEVNLKLDEDSVILHEVGVGVKKGTSSTDFYEEEYKHQMSIAANTADQVFLIVDHTSIEGLMVDFKVKEATSDRVRIGKLMIATNGTDISLVEMMTETDELNLMFSAVIDNDDIVVRVSSTSANASTMRAIVKKIKV